MQRFVHYSPETGGEWDGGEAGLWEITVFTDSKVYFAEASLALILVDAEEQLIYGSFSWPQSIHSMACEQPESCNNNGWSELHIVGVANLSS